MRVDKHSGVGLFPSSSSSAGRGYAGVMTELDVPEASLEAGNPRYEVYERTDGKWDWRLVSTNGNIVATSGGQGFRDATDVLRAIGEVEAAVNKRNEIRIDRTPGNLSFD